MGSVSKRIRARVPKPLKVKVSLAPVAPVAPAAPPPVRIETVEQARDWGVEDLWNKLTREKPVLSVSVPATPEQTDLAEVLPRENWVRTGRKVGMSALSPLLALALLSAGADDAPPPPRGRRRG